MDSDICTEDSCLNQGQGDNQGLTSQMFRLDQILTTLHSKAIYLGEKNKVCKGKGQISCWRAALTNGRRRKT